MREGRQCARAGLPARAPAGRDRADGCSDGTARGCARRVPTSPRLPRGGRSAPRRRRRPFAADIVAFSDANSAWEPRPCARSSALRGFRRRYACGQVRFLTAAAQTRKLVLALRVGLRALSPGSARSPPATRDLRDAPRGLHRGRPDHGPRPVLSVQHGQARLARRLRTGGARDGEDGPVDRGRVRPQAADDEPCLADRRARRPAVAARLPAAVRAHDRFAPGAALRAPFCTRGVVSRARCSCAPARSTRSRSPEVACRGRAAAGVLRAAAARRALLV